jgi:uncharacterized protein
MILDETYNFLKGKYNNLIKNMGITDARIGAHLSAVRLSGNLYGVAGTVTSDPAPCDKKNRDFAAFTPLKIKGQKITDLFETAKRSDTIDTLRIASLNAISSGILSNGKYRILENTDPIDLVDLRPGRVVTLVGAFRSYIQKIAGTGNRLYVLEFNENTLGEEHKKFYVPAGDYPEVLPVSDILIITGLTLVNHTLDDLLAAVSSGTEIIVTGPSSSLVPDILFEHRVKMIGATRITDPSMLFDIVSEGGTGYHLFRYCAQKICILKNY